MNYLLLIVTLIRPVQLIAEYPYCFRFTWIGPYQDKANIANLSCDILREDATNIPCRLPLLATDNDNVPDTLDLWRRHGAEPNKYGCPMTPGQVCVKYTYIYNKGIQNITYMCAKVNSTVGCYRQRYISGLNVEVCVCESGIGSLPCNLGASLHLRSIGRGGVVLMLTFFILSIISGFQKLLL